MEKISVIVPIYNCKEYLSKCIDSILDQTYSNIEIILVDDESTDGSDIICKEYARKHEQITYFFEKNAGPLIARNLGVTKAAGDYLLFVDADDWIDREMCSKLMAYAKEYNADVVRCALVTEKGKEKKVRKDNLPKGLYSKEQDLEYLLSNIIYMKENGEKGTNNTICTQLTKREIMYMGEEITDSNIRYGEDFVYVLKAMLHAKRILLTDDVLYHYLMRDSSVTHNSNYQYYAQINALFICLKRMFEKSDYKEQLMHQLEKFMDELALRGINSRFIIPREPRIPNYVCALNKIPVGTKIILYGAGEVGKSFYSFFRATRIYEIVGWVDKEWEKCQAEQFPVENISSIISKEYDVVIIAIKNKETSQKIKINLNRDYGIDKEKIIWLKPESSIVFFNNS